MRHYAALAVLLVAFLIVGTLYAVYTPDWQAPDEPAHYNYVRQLAQGDWPIIELGDYNQAYQNEVISSRFAPGYTVDSFEYEDYQPPLYYLLQTPIFWLSNGNLTALRIFSVVLGAGVVLLTFLATRRLFPNYLWIAFMAAAFVAFLPQHVAIMASVNNDSLAELLIAAIILLLLGLVAGDKARDNPQTRSWQTDKWLLVGLGILLGLGFLTKVTAYIMAPVIGLVLLWKYWGRGQSFIRAVVIVFGLAFLLGLIWWIRNIVVYGFPDFLGTGAHNAIVVGQPKTIEWIREKGYWVTLEAFGRTTFQSFWGQFGWMGVVMPAWIYRLLLIFSLLTGFGLVLAAWLNSKRSEESDSFSLVTVGLLFATFALSLGIYLAYNLTFVQHQGRYLFSALVPIGIGVAGAWATLVRPVTDRQGDFGFLVAIGFMVLLLGLDLIALFWFIVPALAL